MSTNPHQLPITQLARLLRQQQIRSVELLERCLAAISQHEGRLNSFITLFRESALAQAEAADRRLQAGHPRSMLDGIPIALKDLIYLKCTRTTCGSRILSSFEAPFTATVAQRLLDAGAVLIGKTNLHEFAFGVTTENPHFGTTPNPWDTTRIAGGSSGGSSVALVAGFCAGALGTDTGGSVRIPAALCGHVGLKPTFGRVSVYGVVELAHSLDCVGPMTRTVADAALLMNVLAGHDPRDPHTVPIPVPDYRERLGRPVEGLRIGVPRQHFFDHCDPEVERQVHAAIDQLGALGMIVQKLDLPIAGEAHAAARPVLLAEAAAFHAERLAEQADVFGKDVREMLDVGARLSAREYVQAVRVRDAAQRAFSEVFRRVDLIATPTVPIPAPPRSDVDATGTSESNRLRPLLTQNTRTFNLLGLPALTLPCGRTVEGLPIGLQLAGPHWSESLLFQIGFAYEQVRDLSTWQAFKYHARQR